MIVPEVDVVAIRLFLIGFRDKFDRHHRAGFHAGLLAAQTSLFIPVEYRCINRTWRFAVSHRLKKSSRPVRAEDTF